MFTTAKMRAILDQMNEIHERYEGEGFFPAYSEHDAKRLQDLGAQYWEAKKEAGL